MLRSRLLILLGGCLLAASVAWAADDVGYIDCQSHPQNTQVLARASKTQDVVASLPCGERFSILLDSFFFARIQSKDGKVGYVLSSSISRDHSAANVRKPNSAQAPAPASNVPATSSTVVVPRPITPAQPQSAPAQPPPAQSAATTSIVPPASATVVDPRPTTPAQPQPALAQPAPAQVAATTSVVPPASATVVEPKSTTPPQPQPAPAQPPAAQVAATISIVPPSRATALDPEPTTPPQPQPTPTQPTAQAPRGAGVGPGLGWPIPGVRREPMVELFGGYSYVRFNGGGYINGGLGSFGWNVKPWLQIVTDAGYSLAIPSGAKFALYGSHLGPRFIHHGRSKWGASPFIEALFGKSRVDVTVSGPGGYQSSERGFSMKVGGGLDLNISPHITIRLFDVDYYRTPFIVNSQDNYWAFAGIVLRLGGGRPR